MFRPQRHGLPHAPFSLFSAHTFTTNTQGKRETKSALAWIFFFLGGDCLEHAGSPHEKQAEYDFVSTTAAKRKKTTTRVAAEIRHGTVRLERLARRRKEKEKRAERLIQADRLLLRVAEAQHQKEVTAD